MNRLAWLDVATAKIRFRPDREAVRRELAAHFEDLREEAAAAVLTLHMEEGDYVVEGIREGGAFLFCARPEPDEEGRVLMGNSWFWQEKLVYELEFFNKGGNSICQVSG